MGKIIRLLLPAALLSLTFMQNSVHAQGTEIVAETQNTQTHQLENGVIYRVTPEDEEWSTFNSKEEKVEALRISSDVLEQMTTEEVVDAVLSYPLLYDIYAFNTPEAGIKVLAQDSDAFKELQSRVDASDKLSERSQMRSLAQEDALQPRTIELLLTSKELQNSASSLAGPGVNNVEVVTLRTPKGSPVTAYKRSPDMTAAEKIESKRYFTSRYPNAQFVSDATTDYNCHSYSFYSRLVNNPYWINEPYPYMTDGSYTQIFGVGNAAIGTRMFFNSPNPELLHSGIVTGSPSGVSARENLTITSKWGQGPLMKHVAKDSPYPMSDISMYKAN